MAEQATAEKDKAKEAAPAAVPAKGKGGLIGPLLAGVVLVGPKASALAATPCVKCRSMPMTRALCRDRA